MNIDLITYSARIPGPGETVVGDRFQMGFGGKGANQAVMARLLGARVAMVGCLGDDQYREMTLANFNRLGIDTTHVHRTEGSSGVAPIWVEPDGTNRIIVIPGANFSLTPEQAATAVSQIPDPEVVIGQFEIPQIVTAAAFTAARDRGAITVLNPAPAAEIAADLLAVTDWLIPNRVEFSSIAGFEATEHHRLSEFAERLGIRLAVTLGEHGAALVEAGGHVIEAEPPSVSAIDTTGAGDAFVGAFAFGLAAGLNEQRSVRLACLCAADSVTRPGTQASFPSDQRCRRLLEVAAQG
jgi:ribokinase